MMSEFMQFVSASTLLILLNMDHAYLMGCHFLTRFTFPLVCEMIDFSKNQLRKT